MNERVREELNSGELNSRELQALTARVREVLDDGARQLEADTLSRLYASRRQAVASLQSYQAQGDVLALKRHPLLWGLGGLLLLAVVWVFLQNPLPTPFFGTDTSDLDIQLLTGELPPQVFADWSLVTRENTEALCLTDS